MNDEIKRDDARETGVVAEGLSRAGQSTATPWKTKSGRPHTWAFPKRNTGRNGPLMDQWQDDLYNLLMDRTEWGTVNDPKEGPLDVRQDAGRIGNSLCREK